MAEIDIKQKIQEALDANPELVEKVKNAPGEAVQAIKDITGLELNASNLDKVKAAFADFAGDDGLDLGDFQRAAESLFAKGKAAAANVDVDQLKSDAADALGKGAAAATDLLGKGANVADDLLGKGKEFLDGFLGSDGEGGGGAM